MKKSFADRIAFQDTRDLAAARNRVQERIDALDAEMAVALKRGRSTVDLARARVVLLRELDEVSEAARAVRIAKLQTEQATTARNAEKASLRAEKERAKERRREE